MDPNQTHKPSVAESTAMSDEKEIQQHQRQQAAHSRIQRVGGHVRRHPWWYVALLVVCIFLVVFLPIL